MVVQNRKFTVLAAEGKINKFFFSIALFSVFSLATLGEAKKIPGLESFEVGEEDGWVLKKNKKGIKCYTRPVKISPMHSFKGVGEVKGKIPHLVAFLMDIERYPEWMYPLTESFILERIDETEAYIYNVLKPPWPATARDGTVRRQWYYYPDTGAVIVTIKGITDYVSRRDKIVRGEMIIAYYELMPKGDNTIEITYEGIADPGGWLPVWLINFCVVFTPYSS